MITQFQEIDAGHECFNGTTVCNRNLVALGLPTISSISLEASLGCRPDDLDTEYPGTHLTAPRHSSENGASVERSPLEQLILPGHLLDLTHEKIGEAISVKNVGEA
ncbi:cyclase family protein [Bradyrhizobium vignae]|uniref:cyclase family protein n=1 Tax=Bradyrhizobium vignae TaxID=1549949 RepID=UPI000EFF5DBB